MGQFGLNIASDADHWTYVGEGNLNLVVRYIGDNAIFKDKVLRVVKRDKNKADSIRQDSAKFKQQFIEKVIKPLLGDNYVVPMSPVSTSAEFLQQLAHNVEPHRPSFRLNKQINTESRTSFLLQDLIHTWSDSPTLTFELKPKWGFKPNSPHISTAHYTVKQTYCRFCMHSHLRGINVNNFCPLDLYSMDRSRIRRALNVLLKEKTLKKTLKVAMNGNAVPLDNTDRQKETLLSTFSKVTNKDTLLQDILENILMQDPILQVLKKLQMQLDELDVEGIYTIYKNNEQHRRLVTNDIHVWEQVVARFKKRRYQKVLQDGLINEDEHRQRIFEYILSMTFKDCSLMINVTPITTISAATASESVVQLENGSFFQYNIKVIDTDLKSIDKIPYWFELDQSIVNHEIQANLQKKHCV